MNLPLEKTLPLWVNGAKRDSRETDRATKKLHSLKPEIRPGPKRKLLFNTRWWFQLCLIFDPIWGRFQS